MSRTAPFLLAALFLFSGCLPFSCRRTESRSVAPSDSLSRAVAALITPDTLRLAWRETGPEQTPMSYPRTLRFLPDGRLLVSDAEEDRIYVLAPGGDTEAVWTWDGMDVPYIAGLRGDTVVVFNPEAHRFDFAVGGSPVRSVASTGDLPDGAFQYAAASDHDLFVKVVADGAEGFIVRLNADGTEVGRTLLPGPHWRYAGLLRTRGDTLMSLSGFRPVVDVMPPGGSLDTLALVGFDSPMLPRSYSFMRGEGYEAPLLTTTAVPVGDRLFVLNLRAGWLRVDVYDRTGRLQHILVEHNPAYNKNFYPMDMAVRRTRQGQFEIAVALVQPTPQVVAYDWDVP